MMMKLANTCSVMWPASMLANRRTLCEIGRDTNESISISDDQRQDVDRHALWHEQLEEVEAVADQAVDQHDEEHRQRERRGNDDVAGDRERVGDQADHVQRSART